MTGRNRVTQHPRRTTQRAPRRVPLYLITFGVMLPGPVGALAGAASAMAVGFSAAGCGPNRLQDRAPETPVEDAQVLLENGHYTEARTLLEPYLVAHPDDHRARALLAASHAAEAGINLYALAESTLSNPGQTQEDLIAPLVPEPTASAIASVRLARTIISAVPADLRTPDIGLGATVYSAIYTLLLIKQLTSSTTAPTAEQALEVLQSLDDAAVLAAANGVPASQIAEAREQIRALPGATDAEKLAAYIAEQKAKSGGSLPQP